MKILPRRIVCDENGRPVEARMDYEEFVRLERAEEGVERRDNSAELMAFAGKVKWDEDPVEYQRRLRDEWD